MTTNEELIESTARAELVASVFGDVINEANLTNAEAAQACISALTREAVVATVAMTDEEATRFLERLLAVVDTNMRRMFAPMLASARKDLKASNLAN